MLLLIVGAKGGVGATTLAYHISQYLERAVRIDAADGALAARLGGRVLDLSQVGQWPPGEHVQQAERAAQQGQTYLYTRACHAFPVQVTAYLQMLKVLGVVVVDGGLAPPEGLAELADVVLVVSRDQDPVAAWHEQRLKAHWPNARIVVGDLKAAAQGLGAQYFGEKPPGWVDRLRHTVGKAEAARLDLSPGSPTGG